MHIAISVLNEMQNLCLICCSGAPLECSELLMRPKEGIKQTADCTSQWIQQSQESYLSPDHGTTVQILVLSDVTLLTRVRIDEG